MNTVRKPKLGLKLEPVSLSSCPPFPPLTQPQRKRDSDDDISSWNTSSSDLDLSDFPPVKEGNNPPFHLLSSPRPSRYLPKDNKTMGQGLSEEAQDHLPPASQLPCQTEKRGLGRKNVLNMIETSTVSAKHAPRYNKQSGASLTNMVPETQRLLKREPPAQVASGDHEHVTKKRRLHIDKDSSVKVLRYDISNLRETIDRMATEAKEERGCLQNTLNDILCELHWDTRYSD